MNRSDAALLVTTRFWLIPSHATSIFGIGRYNATSHQTDRASNIKLNWNKCVIHSNEWMTSLPSMSCNKSIDLKGLIVAVNFVSEIQTKSLEPFKCWQNLVGRDCCSIIFRPHIMGEENHYLCCVFFQILAKLHFISTPLHLVTWLFLSYLTNLLVTI